MRNLIQRTISSYGAEGDDAFASEDVIEFLNSSYSLTVSMLSQMEKSSGTMLRSLDPLRFREKIDITSDPFVENGYEVVEVALPQSVIDIVHASYINGNENKTIRLRELQTDQLTLLEMGNTRPNWLESFYHITKVQGATEPYNVFEIYSENINTGIDKVRIYYIRKPSEIEDTDTELPELPNHLIDAVIYGACVKMALKVEDSSITKFRNMYHSEIKNNAI